MVPLEDGDEETATTLGREAGDVDVVIDYLWGRPTEQAIPAILKARTDRSKALHWVQIGSMAGQEISLPPAFLRAGNLNLFGSGQVPSEPTPSWPNCPRSPTKSVPAR
ncbi:hypothetical protein [Streptomyces nigrescens]|uniref:hypothetical protein n=1 Tax=Streptomyces nigrescens TaxID=1920 RepID=UPI0036CD3007